MRVLRLSLPSVIFPCRQDGVLSCHHDDEDNSQKMAIIQFCDFWRVADQTDGSDAGSGSFRHTYPAPWITVTTDGRQTQKYVVNDGFDIALESPPYRCFVPRLV